MHAVRYKYTKNRFKVNHSDVMHEKWINDRLINNFGGILYSKLMLSYQYFCWTKMFSGVFKTLTNI